MSTKMSMRNTLEQIKSALAEASKSKAVKSDKNLWARMQDTSEALVKGEKIAKRDLLDLLDDCFAVVASAESKPDKEKPSKKKQTTSKKESSLKSKKQKDAEQTEEEKPKQSNGKGKKSEPAKEQSAEPKAEKKAEGNKVDFSKVFPEEFEDEDNVYTRADDIKNIKDIRKAIENGDDLYIVRYISKKILNEMGYCDGQVKALKEFPDDRDIMAILYVGEKAQIYYALSTYTEAMLSYTGTNMRRVKDGYRRGVVPYEVYRGVEKSED